MKTGKIKTRHNAARRKKYLERKISLSGASPGTFIVNENSPKPLIRLTCYDKSTLIQTEIGRVEDIRNYLNRDFRVVWIDVMGLGDATTLNALASLLDLHPLAMADVVNTNQRAKTDVYDGKLFIITEFLLERTIEKRESEQISLFLGGKVIVTFQDGRHDHLQPIRERIRSKSGHIRDSGCDYLAFAVLDYAIDLYYPVLEELSTGIENLEDLMINGAGQNTLQPIYEKRRDILFIRRNIWNERDSVSELIRSDSEWITPEVKISLRDCLDHIAQISDMIEMNRDLTSELMNFHLSSLNHRLNESIKILTIISTIFIPLTFLVGIYGMNFSPTPLPANAANPFNMPELYSPYGYIGFWIVTILLSAGLFFFFKSKGWIGKK